jgi:hypothetical protein
MFVHVCTSGTSADVGGDWYYQCLCVHHHETEDNQIYFVMRGTGESPDDDTILYFDKNDKSTTVWLMNDDGNTIDRLFG